MSDLRVEIDNRPRKEAEGVIQERVHQALAVERAVEKAAVSQVVTSAQIGLRGLTITGGHQSEYVQP